MLPEDTTNPQPQASGASLITLGLDSTATWPDVDRPDVAVAVVWQRAVANPEEQRAVVDATLAGWDVRPWPDDLTSRTCYFSTDGQRVLTYEQWRAEPSGTLEQDAIAFQLYRSGTRDNPPPIGCVVAVEVQTEGPDTARRWIDAVFDALASEPSLHPGGIAGHFHVSLDGTRVLNYAEWVDEASHVEAIGGTGSIGRSPAWQRVQAHPGVRNLGFRRYVLGGARQGSVRGRPDG